MRLYYTVASTTDDRQTKAGNSLGGFRSSTMLPNGTFDNLFGEISMLTIQRGDIPQYIGLILRNETGAEVTDIEMWFDFPENLYSNVKVSAVALNANGYMECLPNINSRPLMADFVEANGEANAVGLGALPIDGAIGLWFERTLNLEDIKRIQSDIYEVDPSDSRRFLPVELAKFEDIKINIRWP